MRTSHDTIDDLRDTGSATVSRLRARAEPMIDRLADSADHLRWQMGRASDRSVLYMREHPYSSALIAGAVGALVFMAVRMLTMRDD